MNGLRRFMSLVLLVLLAIAVFFSSEFCLQGVNFNSSISITAGVLELLVIVFLYTVILRKWIWSLVKDLFGFNKPTHIKPSGNVSIMCNHSSGIEPVFNKEYKRRTKV